MDGWIKIDRSILTWRWYTDTNTKIVFLHLLLTANYEDRDYKNITVHRGEVLTTQARLAEELGLSRQQVRSALDRLKSTNEITTSQNSKYTVISIPNYDYYQSSQPSEQPTNNQQITSKQPTNNQQYIRNIRNIRNKEYIYADEELQPCGKLLYLSDKQYEELEGMCDSPGELIKIIDRVDEWLLSHPKPRTAHYEIVKAFIKNDATL